MGRAVAPIFRTKLPSQQFGTPGHDCSRLTQPVATNGPPCLTKLKRQQPLTRCGRTPGIHGNGKDTGHAAAPTSLAATLSERKNRAATTFLTDAGRNETAG